MLAAFNGLLDGIRHANVDEVMGVYWNSPRLNLFNYNGTVTKGWEQVRKNRESSYPEIKDVKLEVRDVSVTMLGEMARWLLVCGRNRKLQRNAGNCRRAHDTCLQARRERRGKRFTCTRRLTIPNPASHSAIGTTPTPSPTPSRNPYPHSSA